MNRRFSAFSGLGTGMLALLAMGLVLLFPQTVQRSAQDALLLCGRVVIPSLFPFFVLSSLLIASGLADFLSRGLAPLTGLLFRLPPCCALPLLLGMVSGYPIGAVTAARLCEEGRCSRRDASRMLAFCNNSGPAFVVGSVGVGMLGSPRLGWLLYGVHIFSALLCGLLASVFTHREELLHTPLPLTRPAPSPLQALVDSVRSSVRSMLHICGFILFFSVMLALLDEVGFFTRIADLLGSFLPLDEALLLHLMPGLLEITTGLNGCASYGSSLSTLVLMEMMLSFGGLCVLAQVASAVAHAGLSLGPYVMGKTLSALLSGLLLYILLLASPSLAQAFAWNDPLLLTPDPLVMLGAYLAVFAATGTLLLAVWALHRLASRFFLK